VRAVSQSFLADEAPDDAEVRMREGFERACRRVFELSRQSPSLRGMGTTLTVLNLLGDTAVLGHVGDTRCYRLRDGDVAQLTEDHAVAGQENRLTRCIGGGRAEEQIDVVVLDVRPGDRYLLATDGLWDAVPAEDVQCVFGDLPPQDAADELVRLSNAHGGLDNSTAVVVSVLRTSGDPGALREVRLPAEESPDAPVRLRSSRRLHTPRWPWVILTVSALLGGLAVAKMGGLDVVQLVLEKFR
jgi:protein phosphatase